MTRQEKETPITLLNQYRDLGISEQIDFQSDHSSLGRWQWAYQPFADEFVANGIRPVAYESDQRGQDSLYPDTCRYKKRLGLNRKTIQRDLAVLQERKLIQWNGSDKTGHWVII